VVWAEDEEEEEEWWDDEDLGKVLVYEALSYWCMGPYATGV
jgi:hypothetical protein